MDLINHNRYVARVYVTKHMSQSIAETGIASLKCWYGKKCKNIAEGCYDPGTLPSLTERVCRFEIDMQVNSSLPNIIRWIKLSGENYLACKQAIK